MIVVEAVFEAHFEFVGVDIGVVGHAVAFVELPIGEAAEYIDIGIGDFICVEEEFDEAIFALQHGIVEVEGLDYKFAVEVGDEAISGGGAGEVVEELDFVVVFFYVELADLVAASAEGTDIEGAEFAHTWKHEFALYIVYNLVALDESRRNACDGVVPAAILEDGYFYVLIRVGDRNALRELYAKFVFLVGGRIGRGSGAAHFGYRAQLGVHNHKSASEDNVFFICIEIDFEQVVARYFEADIFVGKANFVMYIFDAVRVE